MELNRLESTKDTRRERRRGGDGAIGPYNEAAVTESTYLRIITICNQHGGSYRGAGPDPKNEVVLRANGHYY